MTNGKSCNSMSCPSVTVSYSGSLLWITHNYIDIIMRTHEYLFSSLIIYISPKLEYSTDLLNVYLSEAFCFISLVLGLFCFSLNVDKWFEGLILSVERAS